MRKVLLPLVLVCSFAVKSNAAVGDTTWVQAHSDVWMPNYGNYDTITKFPDGTTRYRKIYMIYTLGKYVCPGNPQYCGDWDYTVHNYLMTKGGDTVELSRLITPYANASNARTPWSWKERYVFDVTDFYPLLKDSATLRINYSGYSGGFTANIKFAFIEGTPNRNVIGIDRMWHGYFAYGKASDPIENHLPAMAKTAPANTVGAVFKLNITGHGADNTGCGEFCKKYYRVKLNSTQINQTDIWRDDCGLNHLYPQTGTWVYDRANWCPGDLVHTNVHPLTGVTAPGAYSLDLDLEPYAGDGNNNPGYDIEGHVFYYGNYNRTVDADLTEIVSPSNHEMYFRDNATDSKPIIKVKNNGVNTITALKIEYAVNGGTASTYNWTGSLAPQEEVKITLPAMLDLRMASGNNNTFTAKIVETNGNSDEDASNNQLQSWFTAAPQWAMTLVFTFTTNKDANGSGKSETTWKILDGNGAPAYTPSVPDPEVSKTYTDTVTLPPGTYKLVVTDEGCNGLYWWANAAGGAGRMEVRNTKSIIPLKLDGYFSGDFGCEFTQAFNVNWPTSVEQLSASNGGMNIYPNPAADIVNVNFAGMDKVSGVINITDALGRVVLQQVCNSYSAQVSTSALSNGVYNLTYTADGGTEKLHARLVISK